MTRLPRLLRTAYEYLVMCYGLGLLGVLCLAWSGVAALLYPVLARERGRVLGRRVIQQGFRFYLWALSVTGTCRFDISGLDALRGQGPMIVAPNHPSLLDAVMLLSRLPDAVCIMKAALIDNVFLGAGARLARYIRSEPMLGMVLRAVDGLRAGGQLLMFPEGTRTARTPAGDHDSARGGRAPAGDDGGARGGRAPLGEFKGALAVIAQRARVPVQTVFIETDSPYLGKGWPLFRKPPMPVHFRVRLGRRFDPPTDIHAFMAELERYFAAELRSAAGGPRLTPDPACIPPPPAISS